VAINIGQGVNITCNLGTFHHGKHFLVKLQKMPRILNLKTLCLGHHVFPTLLWCCSTFPCNKVAPLVFQARGRVGLGQHAQGANLNPVINREMDSALRGFGTWYNFKTSLRQLGSYQIPKFVVSHQTITQAPTIGNRGATLRIDWIV
jgi:hypothetical protein